MKYSHIAPLFIALLPTVLYAQRGTVSIPSGSALVIPPGAIVCADTFYANNPGFGTLTYPNPNSICKAVVIPVELLAFGAEFNAGVVTVRWVSAREGACTGYETQRKAPAGNWLTAGFVPCRATGGEGNAYEYNDTVPARLQDVKMLFYRLRIVGSDGASTYSPAVEVPISARPFETCLRVHPNPASDRLTVQYTLPENMPVRIVVYSASGREMFALTAEGFSQRGEHAVPLDLTGLPPGTYLVELLAGNIRTTGRIVIAR